MLEDSIVKAIYQLNELRENFSEQSGFTLLKDLLNSSSSIDFIRYVFESVIYLKENNPDFWKMYVKFVEKNYRGTNTKTKICRRATRYLPLDLHLAEEVLFETHRQIGNSGDSEKLVDCYTELVQKMTTQGTQSIKLSETFFKLLINQTGRKVDSPDFFDDLQMLLAHIHSFNDMFGDRKELNFHDRKGLAGIYRSYLQFLMRLDKSDLEKIAAVDVCERLVKISGNEAENWLLYTDFLKHANSIAVRDPIRAIYKRGLRFCKGDLDKIYREYRDFEMLFSDNLDEINSVDELYKSVCQATAQDKSTGGLRSGKTGSKVEIQETAPESAIQKMKRMSNIYEKQEQSNITVFIKGLPLKMERSEILDLLPNVLFY